MNTPSSSSSSTPSVLGAGTAAQTSSRFGAHGARKGGAPDNAADLFSSLLSLMNSALAKPGSDLALSEPAASAKEDTAEHKRGAPLDNLMAWVAAPLTAAPTQGLAPDAAPSALTNATTLTPADDARAPLGQSLTALHSAGAAVTPMAATATEATTDTRATGTPVDQLHNMQILATPEAVDEPTLAAIANSAADPAGPAPSGAPSTQADATRVAGQAAPAAGRHAPWRSTSHMAAGGTAQAWHQPGLQAAGASNAPVRLDMAGALTAPRSTVMLDERFSPASNDEIGPTESLAPSGLAVPVAASTGAGADTHGQSTSGGETGTDPGERGFAPDELPRTDSSDDPYAAMAAEAWAMAQAEERMDSFTAPVVRQASVRIGDNEEDSIDVRLSLAGQELDLSFRTDNAQARAELQEHAPGALSELLQREGIQLGDMSVGGQHAGSGQRDTPTPPARPTPAATASRPEASGAAPATPAARTGPGRDDSRPLDLFV